MSKRVRIGIVRIGIALLGASLVALACSDDDAGQEPDGAAGEGGEPHSGGSSTAGKSGGSAAGGEAQAGTPSEAGAGAGPGSAGSGGLGSGGDGGAGGGAGGMLGEAGGAGGENSCVERELLGKYQLDVHSQTRHCFFQNSNCGPWGNEQDLSGTFEIWRVRDASWGVFGKLDVPDLQLDGLRTSSELWDFPLYFYYPKAGENVDIWSDVFPPGWSDPQRATEPWVRVIADVCPSEFGDRWGFVHIDIDLVTGRVLDFARKCDHESATLWDEYRARGTGALDCSAVACNDLENTAPNATLVETAQADAMIGGQFSPGKYHLSSIRYHFSEPCSPSPIPSSVQETLEVVASSDTQGTLQIVSQRPPAAPLRITESYQVFGANQLGLLTARQCGPEALEVAPGGNVHFSASATELKLQLPHDDCPFPGTATYVYVKQ